MPASSEAGTPSAATMSMLSTSSPVLEHVGGDVDVECGQAGTEEVVRLAEGEDPDDLDLWLRAVGQQDCRVVSDGEAVVGCRASVDRDLAEAVRGPAVVEGRRAQPVLMAPRHPDERGAGGRERLALEVDELRVPTERRLRGVDTLHLADLLDQVGWHSTSRGRRLTAVEVRLGPHRHVDTGGDVLEELVDRPLERVGDDERADDEADPHHHGEGGEQEPDLVVQRVPEAQAQHVRLRCASCDRALARSSVRPSRRQPGRRP